MAEPLESSRARELRWAGVAAGLGWLQLVAVFGWAAWNHFDHGADAGYPFGTVALALGAFVVVLLWRTWQSGRGWGGPSLWLFMALPYAALTVIAIANLGLGLLMMLANRLT